MIRGTVFSGAKKGRARATEGVAGTEDVLLVHQHVVDVVDGDDDLDVMI